MRVTVVGSEYVGLVTGACLVETRNTVVCMDKNDRKVNSLNDGHILLAQPKAIE